MFDGRGIPSHSRLRGRLIGHNCVRHLCIINCVSEGARLDVTTIVGRKRGKSHIEIDIDCGAI
jgi:hypothetical protein